MDIDKLSRSSERAFHRTIGRYDEFPVDAIYHGIDNNKLKISLGKQIIFFQIPDEKDGIFILEYDNIEEGYHWISDINEFALEKKPSLSRIIMRLLKTAYKMMNKEKKKDVNRIPDMSPDIDMIEMEVCKMRNKLKQIVTTKKSPMITKTDAQDKVSIFGENCGLILMEQFLQLYGQFRREDVQKI